MKTKLIAFFFALVMFLAFTVPTMADPISNGDQIYLTDGVGSTGGGIFNVYNTSNVFLFETFCIERNEYVSFNTLYTVAIATGAVNGGISGGNPDSLSPFTAFLYYSFRTNTLPSFDKTVEADVNSLQYAIWYLEGEIASTSDTKALALIALAQGSGWTDIGNVRVINIYSYDKAGNRIENQSQLTLVPEPMTLLLLGLGLLGLGITRKLKK